jgi:hypothetical protein
MISLAAGVIPPSSAAPLASQPVASGQPAIFFIADNVQEMQ